MATFKGIDVSKWQKAGQVNFANLKSLGYTFVMARAGFGKVKTQKDTAFDSHCQAAIDAGLKVGAYHYSYAKTVAEAKLEADCFLEWVKGKHLEYPVAYDIEDTCQKSLTKALRTEIAETWLQRVEDAGYYVMLYASSSWLGSKFNMTDLKSFDVWCADWISQAHIKKNYSGSYGMWQYSDSIVVSSVYPTKLDHNYAYKDYAKIITSKKLNNLK